MSTTLNTPVDAREPVIPLPARPVVIAALIVGVLVTGLWALILALLGRPHDITAGAAGAALVVVVTAGSLLALRPSRPRPVSSWATLWLAALVGRLFVTPALAYLLYSAAPLALFPLMLSVAATYVVIQVVEAAVVAAHLKTPSFGTNGDPAAAKGGDSANP